MAATDYSGELTISKEILDRVVEIYRRLRNTLKFLLANTADFDPAKDMLPVEQWLEIDRYALAMTRALQEQCVADYERFEFHKVVQGLQSFCGQDLGAFYVDILKDRLYTSATGLAFAPRRAERALAHRADADAADGADPRLHRRGNLGHRRCRGDTVMTTTWNELPAQSGEAELLSRWQGIREIRAEVVKVLEDVRTEGKIGSSLQAEVEIRASGAKYELLASLEDDLRFVLICSKTTLVKAADAGAEAIIATPSAHTEVRALLALARRCRPSRSCGRTSRTVRPLRHNLFGAGEARDFA